MVLNISGWSIIGEFSGWLADNFMEQSLTYNKFWYKSGLKISGAFKLRFNSNWGNNIGTSNDVNIQNIYPINIGEQCRIISNLAIGGNNFNIIDGKYTFIYYSGDNNLNASGDKLYIYEGTKIVDNVFLETLMNSLSPIKINETAQLLVLSLGKGNDAEQKLKDALETIKSASNTKDELLASYLSIALTLPSELNNGKNIIYQKLINEGFPLNTPIPILISNIAENVSTEYKIGNQFDNYYFILPDNNSITIDLDKKILLGISPSDNENTANEYIVNATKLILGISQSSSNSYKIKYIKNSLERKLRIQEIGTNKINYVKSGDFIDFNIPNESLKINFELTLLGSIGGATKNNNNIPCLTSETMILTPYGYTQVTNLKVGDYVITDDNRKVKIKNIFTSKVKGSKSTYPYIIPKNSISLNYPPQEIKLSSGHLIKYKDKWIHPVDAKIFKQEISNNFITYYHIKLPNYISDNLIINNGTVVESLADKNLKNEVIAYKSRRRNYYLIKKDN